MVFLVFGLATRLLRFQFPDQGLNLGTCSKSPNHRTVRKFLVLIQHEKKHRETATWRHRGKNAT